MNLINIAPGTSTNSGFNMPDIHNSGSTYSQNLPSRYYLVRGVRYSNWMKNKSLPSDFACLADYGITSQTRLGQPYLLNGNRYEVAACNLSTSTSFMIVAQITD